MDRTIVRPHRYGTGETAGGVMQRQQPQRTPFDAAGMATADLNLARCAGTAASRTRQTLLAAARRRRSDG
ncbi:MAG: hypothetical protein AAGG11_07425 [Pseudomonadota bacterium]